VPARLGEPRLTGSGKGPGTVEVTNVEEADGSVTVYFTASVAGAYELKVGIRHLLLRA
jgi:hypothetical protein